VRSSVGFYTNNRSMFQMYAAFGKWRHCKSERTNGCTEWPTVLFVLTQKDRDIS
jgi:hypothetical protein